MLKQVLVVLVLAGGIEGASIEKARMLNIHGLKDAAKQELIDVIYGMSGAEAKADAYYYLGNIALTERKVTVAISAWNELAEKYPNSKRIVEVQQQIEVLKVGLSDTLDVVLENITAQLYFRQAEFWMENENVSTIFKINTSTLPNYEAGLKWLDKVITEFPGTAEAEKAYKYKLFIFLKQANNLKFPNYLRNSKSYSEKRAKSLITLGSLFDAFEAAFPESTILIFFQKLLCSYVKTLYIFDICRVTLLCLE